MDLPGPLALCYGVQCTAFLSLLLEQWPANRVLLCLILSESLQCYINLYWWCSDSSVHWRQFLSFLCTFHLRLWLALQVQFSSYTCSKVTYIYSCSPRRISRKLWAVFEMVSRIQQLRELYASRTCYYARASLWCQCQGLNYTQSQPTVSSTLMHRF